MAELTHSVVSAWLVNCDVSALLNNGQLFIMICHNAGDDDVIMMLFCRRSPRVSLTGSHSFPPGLRMDISLFFFFIIEEMSKRPFKMEAQTLLLMNIYVQYMNTRFTLKEESVILAEVCWYLVLYSQSIAKALAAD